jgi:predicted nucleotidyltransferase
MDRDAILARLRAGEQELRARGVAHAALFGSRARGDNRPDSDVDILIEIAPGAQIGLFQYAEIVRVIEDMFPLPVDVSNRAAQRPFLRAGVQRGAVYGF